MKNKVYEDENITIYSNKVMVGEEADIAGSCIDAALLFADAFATHLKAPKDFLLDFKNDLRKTLSELIKNN